MSYSVEWNPWLNHEEVKKTLAKLHVTFLTIGFMSVNQVLKIVITNKDMAEVYAMNGHIYFYKASINHHDRLEQVNVKAMQPL